MKCSHLLFLPRRRFVSSSTGASAGAADVATEIAALLAARKYSDSATRAQQFLRSNCLPAAATAAGAEASEVRNPRRAVVAAVTGDSEVPNLYRALAAAAPAEVDARPSYFRAAASALVEASARAPLPDGALRLLSQIIDTPAAPLPSVYSCNVLMEKLLALGRHADARRVFGTLAAAGERLGTRAWNTVIRACVMAGDLHEAVWRFRRMGHDPGAPRPDASTYNTVVDALWRAGRGDEAVKVFGEMAEMAIAPDLLTYNAMIDGYMKTGDLEAASELRDRMSQDGFKLNKARRRMFSTLRKAAERPNDVVRNEIIKVCIMANDTDEAIRRLHQMGHDGTPAPDASSYTMVIGALWKARRVDDAVEVFSEMADMAIAPDHSTYTAMINGHLSVVSKSALKQTNRSRNLVAALELRARMVHEGFKPEEFTNSLLASKLSCAPQMGDITALFHEMLAQGMSLHKIIWGRLLEVLLKVDEDVLLGIIEDYVKNSDPIDERDCIRLLDELCKVGKVSSAEKVLRTLAKAGVVLTLQMYNTLILHYCKIGELEGAFSLCRQMGSHDQHTPDDGTYRALVITGLSRNPRIAKWKDVVEEFEKNGLSPDVLTSGNRAMDELKQIFGLIKDPKITEYTDISDRLDSAVAASSPSDTGQRLSVRDVVDRIWREKLRRANNKLAAVEVIASLGNKSCETYVFNKV